MAKTCVGLLLVLLGRACIQNFSWLGPLACSEDSFLGRLVSPVRPTAKPQPRGRLGLSHGETGKKQVVKSFGNNRICNRQASWDFLREKQVRKPVCQITWD